MHGEQQVTTRIHNRGRVLTGVTVDTTAPVAVNREANSPRAVEERARTTQLLELLAAIEADHQLQLAAAHDAGYAAGYSDGDHDGYTRGRGELDAAVDSTITGVQAAADTYLAAARQTRQRLGDRTMVLAVDLFRTILGHDPDLATVGLIGRLRAALELVDDGDLVVDVHPDDVATVVAAAERDRTWAAFTVYGDPGLGRGEARIHGRWADADLTWTALELAAHETFEALTGRRVDNRPSPAEQDSLDAAGSLLDQVLGGPVDSSAGDDLTDDVAPVEDRTDDDPVARQPESTVTASSDTETAN